MASHTYSLEELKRLSAGLGNLTKRLEDVNKRLNVTEQAMELLADTQRNLNYVCTITTGCFVRIAAHRAPACIYSADPAPVKGWLRL